MLDLPSSVLLRMLHGGRVRAYKTQTLGEKTDGDRIFEEYR
jgi:hypothetical protein